MPRSTAAMIGSTCRCSSVAMIAQVTSGRLMQFDVALRDEIGADLGRDLAGAVRVLLGKPDPLHRRMAVRHLAAEQPDPPAADDGEPDVGGLGSHGENLSTSFRGVRVASEPEIQGRILRLLALDSGLAPSARPGMTVREAVLISAAPG